MATKQFRFFTSNLHVQHDRIIDTISTLQFAIWRVSYWQKFAISMLQFDEFFFLFLKQQISSSSYHQIKMLRFRDWILEMFRSVGSAPIEFSHHFFEILTSFKQPLRLDSFIKRSLRSRQGIHLAVYQKPLFNSSFKPLFSSIFLTLKIPRLFVMISVHKNF